MAEALSRLIPNADCRVILVIRAKIAIICSDGENIPHEKGLASVEMTERKRQKQARANLVESQFPTQSGY
jgi:hypothetical protein